MGPCRLAAVRVAFGTDERTELTGAVVEHLEKAGHAVQVLADPGWWPDVGRMVGEAVASGEADLGVVCCWTGTGVSIAANKVSGVRAALCTDSETARGARKWNDANVLALSLRLTSPHVAAEILEAFTSTDTDPGEAEAVSRLQ
jgi:ribose 5-phosphate isomerase B